jgi:hypothetical protein
MENEQQPHAELELGNESNPPMAQNEVGKSEPMNEAKLTEFFSRALSDGQIGAEVGDSAEQEAETAESDEGYEDEALATDENVGEDESEEPEQDEAYSEQGAEEHEPSNEVPRGVKKRLAKLTALRKEAEEKAQKLEEEVESLRRLQAVPKSKNPFSGLDSEEKLQAEFERQKNIRLFCERYPDGFYESENPQEHVSKEEIAKAKVVALRAIEEHLPQQAQFVVARKQYKSQAAKEFPWLKDPSDKRTSIAKRFIEAVPEIKRFPDYEIYAAQLALGMSTYQQQKKNARAGIQQSERAPVMPTTLSSAPRPVKMDEKAAKESYERFRQTGSQDDLAAVFRSKFV